MSWVRVLAVAAGTAWAVSACAAAMPGYSPEVAAKASKISLKAPDPGTVTPTGYQLSATEQGLDCKRLKGSVEIIINRLRVSADRPRPSALARQIQPLAGSISGRSTTAGADIEADIARERARADAYVARMREQSCKTIPDIDAELRKPAAPIGKSS